MTPLMIIALILTALVFVLWAIAMFRVLFTIRRRAAARTGTSLPGPTETLREWRYWVRDPSAKGARRQLLGLTIGVIILSFLVSVAGGGNP